MRKQFLYSLIFITLASCGSSRKANDAREDAIFNKWLNHSKADLIKQWGQPDSTFINLKGEMLLYKEGIDYNSVMNGKYTSTQYSFRKEMYINADSIIYYWRAWRRK